LRLTISTYREALSENIGSEVQRCIAEKTPTETGGEPPLQNRNPQFCPSFRSLQIVGNRKNMEPNRLHSRYIY
jgi:hypothetical protein